MKVEPAYELLLVLGGYTKMAVTGFSKLKRILLQSRLGSAGIPPAEISGLWKQRLNAGETPALHPCVDFAPHCHALG